MKQLLVLLLLVLSTTVFGQSVGDQYSDSIGTIYTVTKIKPVNNDILFTISDSYGFSIDTNTEGVKDLTYIPYKSPISHDALCKELITYNKNLRIGRNVMLVGAVVSIVGAVFDKPKQVAIGTTILFTGGVWCTLSFPIRYKTMKKHNLL